MAKLFNQFTNKQGLIVYDGESSADFGMVVAEAPVFEQPTRKMTVYQVPGRSGDIVFPQDAWNDVQRKYKIWVAEDSYLDLPTKVRAFTSWLNSKTGYLRLEDSFEPDVFRLAYYTGGDNVTNDLMQHGETTLTFTCRPERFFKEGENVITFTGGGYKNLDMFNPTRFNSKPLIYIEGSDLLLVGASGSSLNVFADGNILLDCDKMAAYKKVGLKWTNANSSVTGDFPYFKPGNPHLYIDDALGGTWTKVEVTPRYYTI